MQTFARNVTVENCTLERSGKLMWDDVFLWQDFSILGQTPSFLLRQKRRRCRLARRFCLGDRLELCQSECSRQVMSSREPGSTPGDAC